MLNPYPISQNPVASTSNHLQFEPDRDSASPTPSDFSHRSDDRNKCSCWSLTKERCLIATYKEYYDRLKSTKSSQGKKNIWEDILKQFQSMCFDNDVEYEKSLAQLKEKWRALVDKYNSVCDNNNRTGRERKTLKDYKEIDELMALSDKVNPRLVKETKAHKQDCSSDNTDDILSTENQENGKKSDKRPAISAEGDSADIEKNEKKNWAKGGKRNKKGEEKA